MAKAKKRYIRFAMIAFVCFFGFIGIIILFHHDPVHVSKKIDTKPIHSADIHIGGLSFAEYHENHKLFSFKAQSFEISRKKVGFLRMGFIKTAKLQKVEIDFYLRPEKKTDSKENFNAQNIINDERSDIDAVFKKNDQFKALKLDQIKGLDIDDIEINVFMNDQLTSSIKSKKAGIGFKDMSIVFSGNVSIQANNNSLQCQNIIWINKKNKLVTKNNYLLLKDGITLKGKGLECDYRLRNFSFDIPPEKTVQADGMH